MSRGGGESCAFLEVVLDRPSTDSGQRTLAAEIIRTPSAGNALVAP